MLASGTTSVLGFCTAEGFRPHTLELENIDTGNVDMQSGRLSVMPHISNVVSEECIKSRTNVPFQAVLFMN